MSDRARAGRPRVKICGVTRVEDARLAVELGADFLGLNFHPSSPRFLELERAREIATAVGGRVPLVGVFVNRPVEEIERLAHEVPLDLVQLHGDESPEEIGRLAARAIVAVRLEQRSEPPDLAALGAVWGYLVEARHPELYGGGGLAWRYEKIAGLAAGRRLLVAGGIRPETAVEALRLSGAWGVDVCSGVEASPGIKDPALMAKLFEEIENAQTSAD